MLQKPMGSQLHCHQVENMHSQVCVCLNLFKTLALQVATLVFALYECNGCSLI
jgi:hypothetical protein